MLATVLGVQVVRGLAGNCDATRLLGVRELAMAASDRHHLPTVACQKLKDFANLHQLRSVVRRRQAICGERR